MSRALRVSLVRRDIFTKAVAKAVPGPVKARRQDRQPARAVCAERQQYEYVPRSQCLSSIRAP